MSDIMRLQADVEIEAAAGAAKPRRLSINAYNGGLMTVEGFGPVVIDLNAMELPASVPILADHQNQLASVIAGGMPSINAGALSITATLADSPAAVQVVSLLTSGIALQASVGAQPIARKYIASGEKVQVNGKTITAPAGGMMLVEKSKLREISITPVGADGGTSVSLAASRKDFTTMEPTTDPEQIRREERERIKRIDLTSHGLTDNVSPSQLERVNASKADCIEGKITVEAFQAVCLDAIRASRPSGISGIPASGPGRDLATNADHLTAALLVRSGYSKAAEEAYGANTMDQSRRLHGAAMVDLARAALHIDGRDAPSNNDKLIRAAMSGGSLPIALNNSANKILETTYKHAPAPWRQFASIRPAANFKTHTSVRPSFFGDLDLLPRGGGIDHATIGENTFTWRVATYAKQLKVDRQDFIDDDVRVFSETLPALSRAAARTLNGLVATTILANASSFFSTGNANYFEGAATNLQASSLATAIQMLRQMKDDDGNLLDLEPALLLVAPELEHIAKALVSSATLERYVASGVDEKPTGNPFEKVVQVAVEPRLSDSSFTGYSTTGWYLFTAPEHAAVVVGFLNGLETPTTESFDLSADPDHLAYSWRVYHDFGCALGDPKAAIKSKGAA